LTIDKDSVQNLVTAFVDQEGTTLALVALTHLFRVYPEIEESALAALATPTSNVTASSATTLRKYGIFAPGEAVRPSGEVIRQALILYKGQKESIQAPAQGTLEVSTDRQSRTAFDEWADELAVINRGRNVLEKKLRHLVLNFLRVDALASKKRGATKDRILAAIPTEKRDRVNHLTADDLVETLLWSELTTLIGKEWSLFASVFADRKQFDAHSATVNERFDAHAKDADPLDLALYRRSLKWMSDRIASI
jgi:hypothetical protein